MSIDGYRTPPWHARLLLQACALLILGAIIGCTLLLWPIPALGTQIDLPTGRVMGIVPNSPAAQAGLQLDDRIVTIYTYPWRTTGEQFLLLPLPWRAETLVPMQIDRAGTLRAVVVRTGQPTTAMQLEKLASAMLALICWGSGYLLGIIRQAQGPARVAAWFWLGIGGILGCFPLATYVSYPACLLLYWLLFTWAIPMAVALHCWFPVRPGTAALQQRAQRWRVAALLGSQGVFFAVIIDQAPLGQALQVVGQLITVGFLGSFLLSAILLGRAYRTTSIRHVRRQIRLIAMACLVAAVAWLTLRVVPLIIGAPALVPAALVDLTSGVIPLAYLAVGALPDLYRLDSFGYRITAHSISLLTLVALSGAAIQVGMAQEPASIVLLLLFSVAIYRPLVSGIQQLVPLRLRPDTSYAALQRGARQLGTTLDLNQLVDIVCQSVGATFGHPPYGFYAASAETPDQLLLLRQHQLRLPPQLAHGSLETAIRPHPTIAISQVLQQQIHDQPMPSDLAELIYHPGLHLWAPIVHPQGQVLGLLLLGARGDLDPYREPDLVALQDLIERSALALTNSAVYGERLQGEQTIRGLYERVQAAYDLAATAIAREIHDEVINVNVRLNIATLQGLVRRITDPDIKAELQLALDGERTLGEMLRVIGERLHPSGLDDPFGLPALLRNQVERAEAMWTGECRLVVDGAPIALAPHVQRAAYHITREAVTNAIKHAQASFITLQLCYPTDPEASLTLTVHDNGQMQGVIQPKTGHWGIRNMHESARAVGGEITFQKVYGGGTAVTFSFRRNNDD